MYSFIRMHGRPTVQTLLHYARLTIRSAKNAAIITHHHIAQRPHHHLRAHWTWYDAWHKHAYHQHVHAIIATAYILFIGTYLVGMYQKTMALSDLVDNWNFSTASNFTYDTELETNGSSIRLKAQNYTNDANTSALYHLDEVSGTTAADSSGSANNGTVVGGTFGVGNLNNGISLNGTTGAISAPDAAATSLTQDNTVEAWTKFNTAFGAGTHDNRQGVVDKGAYKLYYDKDTGKLTYELANNSATTWTQAAGNDIRNSWDLNGKFSINAQVMIGSTLYAGLGNAVGDAEVWSWNGTTWTQVGGDGKNTSWADQTFENVQSLAAIGTMLYAGIGSSTGDAEVWRCDTATGCASWAKIGGDALNGSWPVNTFEDAYSMTVMSGSLYVGLGNSANDARIYRYNGTTWTWVGGFGVGLPYNAFPTGYEMVYSLANDGTNLYAGFGNTAGDGDVWRLTGTTWTQVGGDALNGSWAAATTEAVLSLQIIGSDLYAGLGLTAGDGDIWRYNGTTWTQVGGDALNGSWAAATYEGAYSLANDGTNLYAGLGNGGGDNEVWRYNGTTWTKIGGDGLNSGFTTTHTIVQSMVFASGVLYAGNTSTGANAEMWSYNGTTWTRIGGGGINNSWGFFNLQNVESMTVAGGYLYAGLGFSVAGNAQVWRYNGTTWTQVGGQGIAGSWAANTYEDVLSLVSYGGNLYAGLGTTANDAEVWRYNGTTWTQVGGDALNGSWPAGYEEVYSMAVMGGNLFAGLGNTANDAEVWRYNGTTWTKIGGDSLNGGWTTNFERVSSLAVYAGNLVAGLGNSTTDAEVWSYNGTTWTKIGGDGVSSSWNTNYEQVETLVPFNGSLFAGLGNSTGDAEVWRYNGTAWTQVGGDGIGGGWIDGQYEQVKSIASYNGKLYAGLGNSTGDGEVWELDNNTWSRIAGSNVNGSWSNAIETVQSMAVYKGKLYAGLGNSANADASVWSYGNNGYLQATTTGQDTSWHHIAASYDGTTMKLFIDGNLDAQTTTSLSMPDSSQPLLIGTTLGGFSSESGWAQGYFAGSLDEVRISNIARSSLTSKPYTSAPQTVRLANAVRTSGVWNWDAFAATATLNGGTITYRLSNDSGTTWKYHNGVAWVTSTNLTEATTAGNVNTNINTFPVSFGGIVWQAILKGDGSQQVTLNDVTLTSTSDTTPPTSNASSIIAKKTPTGSTITSNSWTNGSSPYFSWTGGNDPESGIKGYCLYLGTDNTSDPTTTKGLLGTSPIETGNNCQFIVDSTSIDLATAGYLATPLTTSNTPYYLRIKAIDNAGNTSGGIAQFQFRFDNTPPTNPGFITAPSGFINTKDVTLTWPVTGGNAAADSNSGLAGLQYRIGESGTWYGDSHTGTGDIGDLLVNDGSYDTVPTPDHTSLQEGINTVYFRSWDGAGNVTTNYVTAAVKINTAGAPSEPQNVTATPTSNTTNAFGFSWSAPATFVGSVNNLSYCYTINSIPTSTNCTFTSPGVTSLGSGPYATQPGINVLYVVARDESNNINYNSFASTTFTANTAAPGIALNIDVVDVSIKSTNNWRLALTWDQPINTGAGVTSYRVYRSPNNITFNQVGTSSSTTYIDAGLAQQRYYYYVRACDNTNNCGSNSATGNGYPTGKFTSPATLVAQPTVSNITTKKARINWSTDRTSDSKISLGTTSGAYSPSEISSSAQVSAHQIDLDNLSAGTTYYYVAKWTDEDGNTGTSQEYSFRTAPAPSLKEIAINGIGLSSANLTFTSKDASKVAVYYGKSDAFGGVTTVNTASDESTYSLTLSNLDDGSKYFYKLITYDAEGNAYDGSIASFNTPPRPRINNLRFQPVVGEPTSTQEISWQTNVPATSQITYGATNGTTSEVQSSELVTEHKIVIRNLQDNSQYSLVAQSRDAAGNLAQSDPQQFKTALDTRPPKISDIVIETSIRGTGAEARGQVIVSWKTDEPASSQVAYGEGSGVTIFNSKTSEDTTLATEHIVIVSDLPTSKVYSIQPVSKDRSGNQGTGEIQPAIIGRASDSVLTIILNSLQKVFGF